MEAIPSTYIKVLAELHLVEKERDDLARGHLARQNEVTAIEEHRYEDDVVREFVHPREAHVGDRLFLNRGVTVASVPVWAGQYLVDF